MATLSAAGLGRAEAKRGHLAMLAFSALVAGSFALGGMAANAISPLALNAVRFLIASAVIGAVALATGALRPGMWRAPWRYAVMGALFAIYFVTMFEGLKTAPPVSAAAVFTLTPAMAAAVGWLWLRQVTTPRTAAALAIGGLGALWVIFRADLGALMAFHVGRGEAIFFAGCVAHAIYPVAARGLGRGEPPLALTFGMLVAASLMLCTLGAPALAATDWAHLPPVVWVTILYTAVVSGAVTFTLLQFAAVRLPAAKVMAYTYLTPAWVALWEIALGHGAPPGLIVIGVALTVVALAMLLAED